MTVYRSVTAQIVEAMQEKKGSDIVVMDMREVSGVSDYFVLCTGSSDLQIKAIIDHIRKTIKEKAGESPWSVEGEEHRQWVLMDYVDVVAHVLSPEKRAFYGLERLWGDAPMETVEAGQEKVALLQENPAQEETTSSET